jgi:hypothetical protein
MFAFYWHQDALDCVCVGINASIRDACQIAQTMAEQLGNQDFEFAISGCV